MLSKIIKGPSKFALIAVNDAHVEFPDDENFLHHLPDDICLMTKMPMGIDDGWKDWIGSIKFETLTKSNMILFISEITNSPELLDEQHLKLENKLFKLFHILQLLGVLEYSKANLVVGSFSNGQSEVRRMSDLPHFIPTGGYTPNPLNLDRIEKSITLLRGYERIESDSLNFSKVKRGIKTLMEGLKEKKGEDRIHNFVRALEALILPNIGQTRKQFIHRCQTFSKASMKSKEILEEAFALRSMAEHLNSWEKALENHPLNLRESIALLRTRQMESLACLSYSWLLETDFLICHFKSEIEMNAFWKTQENQRVKIWGNQIDLEKIV